MSVGILTAGLRRKNRLMLLPLFFANLSFPASPAVFAAFYAAKGDFTARLFLRAALLSRSPLSESGQPLCSFGVCSDHFAFFTTKVFAQSRLEPCARSSVRPLRRAGTSDPEVLDPAF
jgi:hypothetical protein